MTIHSSGQTIFSLTHIEGITLGAGEEVDEVAGGAGGMGVDGIDEIGDRASDICFMTIFSTIHLFYKVIEGILLCSVDFFL